MVMELKEALPLLQLTAKHVCLPLSGSSIYLQVSEMKRRPPRESPRIGEVEILKLREPLRPLHPSLHFGTPNLGAIYGKTEIYTIFLPSFACFLIISFFPETQTFSLSSVLAT
jgi:hypothetical protein